MNKRVGITGGIGSGKSVVSRMLRAMQYKVYDADCRSKLLCVNDLDLKNQLVSAFGMIYNKDGSLNKKLFASIIFNNENELKKANSIIHPFVTKDFMKFSEQADSNDDIVFVESAILLECELKNSVDFVITVSADMETRLNRITNRDKCTVDEAKARISSQMAEEDRVMLADFVINNNENELLTPQLERIIESLL